MLIAMVSDLRVIIVKLADRLHNMQTLDHHPDPAKRERIALDQTLAGERRTGFANLKWPNLRADSCAFSPVALLQCHLQFWHLLLPK